MTAEKTKAGYGAEPSGVEMTATVASDPGTQRTVAAASTNAASSAGLPIVSPSQYRRGPEIARGGMGRIIDAEDLRLGRPVAVKELLHGGPDAVARFEREALISARLQHPAIVAIYEAGRWPSGEPFYAMKRVVGESLDRVVAARPTLRDRIALIPAVLAVFDALAYAHERQIVHRDLKPANVLVGDHGETVVIDWGLAKDLRDPATRDVASPGTDQGAQGADGETVAGAVMGTPSYMPPEQAKGERVDARADVYSLGALLYHVLAGTAPYRANTIELILEAVLVRPPTAIRDAAPGVPDDLATIVETAMAREPARRYPTAKELATDLRRFQTGQLVGAHTYSPRQLVARWLRRHRTAVSVAAAMLVLSAIALGFSFRAIVAAKTRAEEGETRAEEGEARAESSERRAARERDDLLIHTAQASTDPTRSLALLKRIPIDAEPAIHREAWLLATSLITADTAREVDVSLGTAYSDAFFTPRGDIIAIGDGVDRWRGGRGARLGFVVTLPYVITDDGGWVVWLDPAGAVQAWRVDDDRPRVLPWTARSLRARGRSSVELGTIETIGHGGRFARCERVVDLAATPASSTPCPAVPEVRFDNATGSLTIAEPRKPPRSIPLALTSDPLTLLYDVDASHSLFVLQARRGANDLVIDQRMRFYANWAVIGSLDLATFVPADEQVLTTWIVPKGIVEVRSRGDDRGVKARLGPGGARIDRLSGNFQSVALFPDGRHVVGAVGSGFEVWDLDANSAYVVRHAHDGEVRQVAVSADGKRILSIGVDRTLRVWDVPNVRAHAMDGPARLADGDETLEDDSLDDAGQPFIKIADAASQQWRVRTLHTDQPCARRAWLHGQLACWSARTACVSQPDDTMRCRLEGADVELVSASPDGDRLLITTHDGATVWNPRDDSARPLGKVRPQWLSDGRLAFVEAGSLVVADASGAGRSRVAELGDTVCRLGVRGVTLAAACDDGALHVVDVAAGQVRTLHHPSGAGFRSVAVTERGRVAAAGADSRIVVWEAGDDRAIVADHDAATGDLRSLEWSTDGDFLIASGLLTTWLWDRELGLGVPIWGVDDRYLEITPTGKRGVSGVNLFELPPREPAALRAWLDDQTTYTVK